MGLVVTRIYEFIEFYPEECFKELAEEIVETRRKGDRDSDLQVVALTKKLIGMSKFFILELVYSSRLTIFLLNESRSQFLYNFINKLICCRYFALFYIFAEQIVAPFHYLRPRRKYQQSN